jgi:FkbM family methyltransferase
VWTTESQLLALKQVKKMFSSYAQNCEDVILYRTLSGVENGFYVDIGAGHPIKDSVTASLYSKGWSGVNVEPNIARYAELVSQRPRDINLNSAISSIGEKVTLFQDNRQLGVYSTTSEQQFNEIKNHPDHEFVEVVVPCMTLNKVFEQIGNLETHFLKIDVEGTEFDVVKSLDFERHRPWIIVVETFHGLNLSEDRSSIFTHLVNSRYVHVLFDGLNDYFIAKEHEHELKSRLEYGASIRDNYVRVGREEASIELLSKISATLQCEYSDFDEIELRFSRFIEDRASERVLLQEHIFTQSLTIETLQNEVYEFENIHFARERMIHYLSHRNENSRKELNAAHEELNAAHEALNAAHEAIEHLNETKVREVYEMRRLFESALSWKITLPLRKIMKALKKAKSIIGKLS